MSEHATELTEENFDSKTSKGNWVIDFWAAWCGPCKIISPIIDELAKEMKGEVHFGKVDVDSNTDLAQRFEIMSIPTILFLENGEVVNKVIGARDKEDFKEIIDQTF